MDSNERKIVQELVTTLGCVIPASDGYEPRTNLWNKYSAAKNMLAAAPQVVADERAAFESDCDLHETVMARNSDSSYWNYLISARWEGWQARAALAAAPVQAQEPVAEVSAMPGTSGFTIAVFKADDMPIGSKVFRAPVQPVAVPDGELKTALTVFDMGLGFALCHQNFFDTRNAVKKLQSDFAAICAMIAAPASQGDAWLEKCEALLDIWDDSVRPEDQRAYVSGAFPEMLEEIRAAIAAKAAS